MKKIGFLLFSISIFTACSQNHPKNFATVAGQLENNTDSLITIVGRSGILKTLSIDSNGRFKDTLVVENGEMCTFQTSPTKRAPLYLKNGYDIFISGDSEKFMESFTYSGTGANNSNYVLAQIALTKKLGNPELILKLDAPSFQRRIADLQNDFDSILGAYKDLDSTLAADAKSQNAQIIDYFQNAYAAQLENVAGKPSPTFTDYVSYSGGTKSLESFRGKYVYIDVWATWCGPCIQQIPFLHQLEEDYHDKNIAFVSISTDEARRNGGSWEAAEKKWRNFIQQREMTGIQLWSGKDISFQKAYKINGIPRFILIDPKGVIVDANAPRPSDPRLKDLFTSLGI